MKKVWRLSKLFAFGLAVVLVSCKGKEGDPGPTGVPGEQGVAGPTGAGFQQAMENGFIKGTIKGKRIDGTVFEEPFEYKIAAEAEGFYSYSSGSHYLELTRALKPVSESDYLSMELWIANKGTSTQMVEFDDFDLNFTKLLSNQSLFVLNAEAEFYSESKFLPMSIANNSTYKLAVNGLTNEYISRFNGAGTDYYYIFTDTDGNKIYFLEKWDSALGSYYYQFSHLTTPSASSVEVTSSPVWNNVQYKRISTNSSNRGFFSATGVSLHKSEPIPADSQTITNFVHNATTGEVTFDYTVNIHQFRDYNSSHNPVEIRGSVKAKVYNGIVMRKSSENKR